MIYVTKFNVKNELNQTVNRGTNCIKAKPSVTPNCFAVPNVAFRFPFPLKHYVRRLEKGVFFGEGGGGVGIEQDNIIFHATK